MLPSLAWGRCASGSSSPCEELQKDLGLSTFPPDLGQLQWTLLTRTAPLASVLTTHSSLAQPTLKCQETFPLLKALGNLPITTTAQLKISKHPNTWLPTLTF